MKNFNKQLSVKAVAGVSATPEMLAKINGFALEPLAAEQVYVRKFIMAHNAIDRDGERFSEQILDFFAETFPGKSFLFAHDRRSLPFGLWFDATTEEMTPEQFKILTREAPQLPDGVATVKVLWTWAYMLKEEFNAPIIKNIDAGIHRHVSIGFNAVDLIAVKKEINGPTLYWEYVPPGEALEGSLVWLGAQPGATAQKALKDQETHTEKELPMKMLIALLTGLGIKALTDTATEDQIAAGIKALVDEKNARITELEPLAADGKAYREEMVKGYVAAKAKLGEVAETPEAQDRLKAVAAGYPLDFLKSELKHLETRVTEKFPDQGQLDAEDPNAKRGKAADDNPLIPRKEK